MSYYEVFGFCREPFSNSPDPDMLFLSGPHRDCLERMEIAVRLRRGLNVVLGEVGTGKTTLGRELVRLLGRDVDMDVLLLDDPFHASVREFLLALLRLLGQTPPEGGDDTGILREALKGALLRRCENDRRLVTLVIDEGQKLTGECLELLRELLNFETNTHKLLQIVILAQPEFAKALAARPNLDDRVNYRCRLRPLNRRETRRLIETRLALCAPSGRAPDLFTPMALRRLHRLSRGFPRKLVRLCHLSLLLAVGTGKTRIDWAMVGRAARQPRDRTGLAPRRAFVAAAFGGLVALGSALAVAGLDLRPAMEGVVSTLRAGVPRPLSPALSDDAPAAAPLAAASEARQEPPSWPSVPSGPEASPAPAAPGEPDVAAAREEAPDVAASPAVAPEPDQDSGTASGSADSGTDLAAAQAPADLGSARLRQGWHVTRMAARVYGRAAERQAVAALARVNPDLDLDRVRAGQSLVFPVLEAGPPPAGTCLVRLAEAASLDEAVAFIDSHRGGGTAMTVFSTYHPDRGLRFEVVLAARFPGRTEARAAMDGLSRPLAAEAELADDYPSGTVFYTELGDRPGSRQAAVAAATAAGRQVATNHPRTGTVR